MFWLSKLLNDEAGRDRLSAALSQNLPRQKWYARKGEAFSAAVIRDAVVLSHDGQDNEFALLLVDVAGEAASQPADCYVIPVASRPPTDVKSREAILNNDTHALVECSADPRFWQQLLQQTRTRSPESLAGSSLSFSSVDSTQLQSGFDLSRINVSAAEQSNTAVTLGDWGFLKLFRRVEAGLNPDIEIGRFLTQHAPHVSTPSILGTLELQPRADSESLCLAVLLEQVVAECDAWQFTLNSLAEFWQRVAAHGADWSGEQIDADAAASSLATPIGPYLDAAHLLGQRTAELHSALAVRTTNPAFRPELMTAPALAEQGQRVADELTDTCRLLRSSGISENPAALADQLLAAGNRRLNTITQQLGDLQDVSLIRVHGDYHLGQVLRTSNDFVIIDFEGEPDRPLSERREKRCALKDVAGMIRSLHYASNAASVGLLPSPAPSIAAPETWQRQWYVNCRCAFLDGYFESLTAPGVIPNDPATTAALLDLFIVEKALYELRYEINHRPDWVAIPLAGLSELFQLRN